MTQRLGDFLRRRQDIVRRVQWAMLAIYLLLLTAPLLLPQPLAVGARLAEAVFWGLWWPAAILATLLCGQFWCGLLCPDGTMTEFLSRHGRFGKISLKLRWPGWPLLLFSLITLAWHGFAAHGSPAGTLALFGAGSAAAWATGHYLGRGKRLWCRYLCPVSSVFALLARGAMFRFRVDLARWNAAPRPLPRPVDCPQLLDVRRLTGTDKCSMCCRCSGHRDAVALALQLPGQGIAALRQEEAQPRDAFAICFVLIGLGYGIACGHARLTQILPTAAALGAGTALLLWLGALGHPRRAMLMAYGLIPLAGIGLFVGALDFAQDLLSPYDASISAWLPLARLPLLLAGSAWAVVLGLTMARKLDTTAAGRSAAALAQLLAVALVASCYLAGAA